MEDFLDPATSDPPEASPSVEDLVRESRRLRAEADRRDEQAGRLREELNGLGLSEDELT